MSTSSILRGMSAPDRMFVNVFAKIECDDGRFMSVETVTMSLPGADLSIC